MNRLASLATLGFTSDPFSKAIGDNELWMAPSQENIMLALIDAADNRECALLAGEPGVGKTCLLRAVRHNLPPGDYRLTYCHNATLGKRDFYRHLCLALGLSPSATAGALFYAVSSQVEQLGRERLHPIFLLDEAHLLHPDTLDHLHILLNYEWDSKPLLSLFLIGLPELIDRLGLRRNRSLFSRIQHRFVLRPLVVDDTADYLRFRLRAAGCDREIFATDAIALLHERASGTLRDIDRIANAALRETVRRKAKSVDVESVERVVAAEGQS